MIPRIKPAVCEDENSAYHISRVGEDDGPVSCSLLSVKLSMRFVSLQTKDMTMDRIDTARSDPSRKAQMPMRVLDGMMSARMCYKLEA